MFRFEHPEHLYALFIIPIVVGFYLIANAQRRKALKDLGNLGLLNSLMPEASRYKHGVKLTLLTLGLSLIIIGWANPQWGTKKEKVKRKSVDVFIALDISNSMLAQDISPNRMERTKQFGQKLIESLKGDRIGTIIFAGNAYLQMPLTTDYSAAMMFIKSTNTFMAPTQGTAISDAIQVAMQSFDKENKKQKALIIITDGENHEEEALRMATQAYDAGVLIFTVGVGTPDGAPIPMFASGRNDYKRDEEGNIVKTKLNEAMLTELAEAGGGVYFNLQDSDKIIAALRERIERMEKREFEQRVFSEYKSHFQYFIGAGLLLLIIEFLLSYRKNKQLKDVDIFKVE